MDEKTSNFRPTFERAAKTAGFVLATICDGLDTLERNIFEALDKQIVNRLLGQYDRLVKTGFNHQEALDAVTNLVKKRLETAIQERSQNDD